MKIERGSEAVGDLLLNTEYLLSKESRKRDKQQPKTKFRKISFEWWDK